MRFTDEKLYVMGIGTAYISDPETGNILYWTDKMQEANVSFGSTDNVLSAGLGNGPAIIIPTDPNITVNVTAADYSEYVKAASVGGVIAPGAPVMTCQQVTAEGPTLAISTASGTPVAGAGMDKIVCYVQEVGMAFPVSVGGIAYELDPQTGEVSGFAAVSGRDYLVTYHVARANATMTTVTGNFKGKIVLFAFSQPIYTNYDAQTQAGNFYGWLHTVIPRLQLLPGGGSSTGSQTDFTMTGITGRAITADPLVVTEDCGGYGYMGAPMAYRIVEPRTLSDGESISVVVVIGGSVSLNVGESVQLTPTLIVGGEYISGISPEKFRYSSSNSMVVSADQDSGKLIAMSSGSARVAVFYTDPESGVTASDVVRVSVAGEAPPCTTLYLTLTSDLDVKLCYGQSEANAVSVNWGDGSPEESSTDLAAELTHQYAQPGDYSVKMRTAEGQTNTLGDESSWVNVLGADAFKGGTTPELMAIWMDERTKISAYGLSNCTSITNVSIPNSETELTSSEFDGDISLQEVRFGSSFESFDIDAFENCPIANYYVDENNSTLQSMDGIVFSKDLTQLMHFPPARTGKYTIPQSVTSLAQKAFYGTHLQDVELGNVSAIPASAFNSAKLERIDLTNVQSVGNSAFAFNRSMAEIIWPTTPITLGDDAFTYNVGLVDLFVPNNVQLNGSAIFNGCIGLETVVLEEGHKTLPDGTFRNCLNLRIVSLPDTITGKIGANCFYSCHSLESISIPNGVTSIERDAFSYCGKLKSVEMPGVTSIYNNAFYHCEALIIEEIPQTVTVVSNQSFGYCTSIQTLKIGASELANGAFYGCSGLEKAWLRSSVSTIKGLAFNVTEKDTGDKWVEYSSAFSGCGANLHLFCEPASKPSGWTDWFNVYYSNKRDDRYLPVTWGVTESPF